MQKCYFKCHHLYNYSAFFSFVMLILQCIRSDVTLPCAFQASSMWISCCDVRGMRGWADGYVSGVIEWEPPITDVKLNQTHDTPSRLNSYRYRPRYTCSEHRSELYPSTLACQYIQEHVHIYTFALLLMITVGLFNNLIFYLYSGC